RPRLLCDWSSDVCSSDLVHRTLVDCGGGRAQRTVLPADRQELLESREEGRPAAMCEDGQKLMFHEGGECPAGGPHLAQGTCQVSGANDPGCERVGLKFLHPREGPRREEEHTCVRLEQEAHRGAERACLPRHTSHRLAH